jgi:hypothetical protein
MQTGLPDSVAGMRESEGIMLEDNDKAGLDKEFDIDQASAMLAMLQIVDHPPHPKTMRRWLREGRLGGYKDGTVRGRGGAWRIRLSDILAFDPGRSGGKQGRPRKDA